MSVSSYSHPIGYCLLFLLLPVLCTIFRYASWVIFVVAGLAASQWNNWCLHRCCVSAGGTLVDAPVLGLDSNPLSPGSGVCGAMTCCGGQGEEDDNEKKWEVLRNILLASSQNWMSDSQLARSTQDGTYWVQMQVAGDSNGPVMCSKLVPCRFFVYSDTLCWTTAEISSLMNINRTFFDWKDVWWCLLQDISGILHEMHSNDHVMLYGLHYYCPSLGY